ncbi:MAG: ATP-grasp domain-containing protein [Gammaproteobacteria bacterium]|jgi:acetyl-CoA carboxylase biotin carboxylase subunit|nr:MAG: ATP-grasp domain-containing protein [Gammaproteobacteria bacterium]
MNIARLLIANRGEIAARIIRTCRDLGIESVLAASDADLHSTPARQADQVVRIGPPPAGKSYLNIEAVIAAARAARVDALHPGYGFLAENPRLARACDEIGIIFVGPTEANLHSVGDKLEARRQAAAAGLPVVPGGAAEDAATGVKLAETLGYPVLIKAVSGGGGKGMKRVFQPAEMAGQMTLAMAEAGAAFGDPRVYVERYVESGRHVEIQILGDGREVIHLGDRDCSIQRRYQKLLEEAPAPDLPEAVRGAMREAAVALGRQLHYRGLGTVELLYDRLSQSFYFLEVNARIQVEHPVTEAITGLDLVAEQIAVAEGRPLRIRQEEVTFNGHAIECRINAEDPARDFQPSPGAILEASFPAGAGVRVDSHIEKGVVVPPFYDSLLAKVISHGADRSAAVQAMQQALGNTRIGGIATNLGMHEALLEDPEFRRGGYDTNFFTRHMQEMSATPRAVTGGGHG